MSKTFKCDICNRDFTSGNAYGYGIGESVLELDGIFCRNCYTKCTEKGDIAAALPTDKAMKRAQEYLADPDGWEERRRAFFRNTVLKLEKKNPHHPTLLMYREGEYLDRHGNLVKVRLIPFTLTMLLQALQEDYIYPPPKRKGKGFGFGRKYVYWPDR